MVVRATLPKKYADTLSNESLTYILICDFINGFKHIYLNFPQACQRGRLGKREINELILMFFQLYRMEFWISKKKKTSSYYSKVFFNTKIELMWNYQYFTILSWCKNINFQVFKLHSHLHLWNVHMIQRAKKIPESGTN